MWGAHDRRARAGRIGTDIGTDIGLGLDIADDRARP
jgi:hypothetical protein